MNHAKRLRAEILFYSVSSEWDKAVAEWDVAHIWCEEDGTCTCGYHPITERALIRNRNTSTTLVIGRVCIRNFLRQPEAEKLFSAILRCKDSGAKIPERLRNDALNRRIIDEKSYHFLESIHRKRKLSMKQRAWIEDLRKRILSAYRSPPAQ